MTPAAQAKDISLIGDIGQNPGFLKGDEFKLQQVLANLIGNAVRHAPGGSQVVVKAKMVDDSVQLIAVITSYSIHYTKLYEPETHLEHH